MKCSTACAKEQQCELSCDTWPRSSPSPDAYGGQSTVGTPMSSMPPLATRTGLLRVKHAQNGLDKAFVRT